MKNKGFTLVELLVVIAILAVASGLIATRFFALTGDQKDYEDEIIAKGIAEAAYVYYDDPKMVESDETKILPDICYSSNKLLKTGFIPEDQGLLSKYSTDDIKSFSFKVSIIYNEKKVFVYKESDVEDITNCNDDTTLNKYIYSY